MRSIPLHSLVLIIGSNNTEKHQLVSEKFQSHEIIDIDQVKYQLVGHSVRSDIHHLALREVNHRAAIKLKLGERAVICSSNLDYKERTAAADIGLKMGVPTFYVVKSSDTDFTESLFKHAERDILHGDNFANVIDTRIDDFTTVSKLPSDDLLHYIKQQGYKGLCVVPDVHGMLESLKQAVDWARARGLFLIFLGDILDYGPDSIDCVYLVYDLVMRGRAVLTIGNHERKIEKWLDQQQKLLYDPQALKGNAVLRLSEGNKVTTMAVDLMSRNERNKFESRFKALLAHSCNHWVLGNAMLFAHAAVEPEMFDITAPRLTGRLESRAMFGEIDEHNPQHEDGYPNRIYNWVDRVPEGKKVLVGHDIRSKVKPLVVRGSKGGIAYFMDTGSGKGGRLTTADIIFRNDNLEVQNFTAH